MTDRLIVLGWGHPDGTPPTVEEEVALCTGPLHAGTVLRAELRLLTRGGQVDDEALAWLRDGQARGLWLRVALAGESDADVRTTPIEQVRAELRAAGLPAGTGHRLLTRIRRSLGGEK